MTTPFVTGRYYVADIFGKPGRKVISGPFDSAVEAEHDRRGVNIDGDCLVVLATSEHTIESDVANVPT